MKIVVMHCSGCVFKTYTNATQIASAVCGHPGLRQLPALSVGDTSMKTPPPWCLLRSNDLQVSLHQPAEEPSPHPNCPDCNCAHDADRDDGPAPAHEAIKVEGINSMTLAEAISELNQINNIGDSIYKVISRAVEDEAWGPYEGDSWWHPAVKRYGALLNRIDGWLKAAGQPTINGK